MFRLLSKPLRLHNWQRIALKTIIHVYLMGYMALTFHLGLSDQLGADPVEALLEFTGIGAVNLLLVTLLLSPLAKTVPFPELMKFRRMIGLYAFTYAAAHFATYLLFELQLQWQLIVNEITSRPFIIVGFIGLLILTLLAITSFTSVRKALGKKWQVIHNFVYIALILILLHFSWSQKTIYQSAFYYCVMGAILLLWRFNVFKKWFRI